MKKLLSSLLVLAALGLAMVPSAVAQVAVSDHSVAMPRMSFYKYSGFNSTAFTADNPAAISWLDKSQIGAGFLSHQVLDDEPDAVAPAIAPPQRKFSSDGLYFGGRLVGEAMGFAAGHIELNRNEPDYLLQERNSEAQFSFKMNQLLSFGLGFSSISRTDEVYDSTVPQFVNNTMAISRRTIGVSLKMGDVFYLGAAAHRDKGAARDVTNGLSQNGDRAVTLAGFAIRSTGKMRWFMAVDQMEYKAFSFQNGTLDPNSFKVTNVTLQGRDDEILLGFSQQNFVTEDKNDEIVAQSMNFGYKPYGTFVFGVGGTVSTHKNKVTNPADLVDIAYTNIGVSLGFEF